MTDQRGQAILRIRGSVEVAATPTADTDAEGRWKNMVDNTLAGVPLALTTAVYQGSRAFVRAVRGELPGATSQIMSGGSPEDAAGSIINAHEPASAQAGTAAGAGRRGGAVGSVPDAGGRGAYSGGQERGPLADLALSGRGSQSLQLTELAPDPGAAGRFRAALQARYDADQVGKQVTVLSPDELQQHRLFVADGGDAGYAISPTGEIVGLFKSPGSARHGVAQEALRHAVAQGGTHLNAFAGYLTRLYAKSGFVEVARLKFSREFAPKGWDYQVMGEPDIVFMRYDPAAVGKAYQPGSRYVETYDEGLALARGEQ